jgi:monovalent cation:H+ antiporter, CPA1 family
MVLSLPLLLSLFSLLALSSAIYFLAERTKIPYTVLLVAVGTFVLVPLSSLPYFSFLRTFTFTPEILFYVFLPILIFESAYNIQVRRLMENVWSISILSVVSLLISTGIIAGVLFYLFPLMGIPAPFIVCILFGALISATDPVAVLALFKELGAPRRLTLLFEGESIFNDGTAVALFLVVLSVALHGWHGTDSILEGISMFATMIILGVGLGLLLGALFVKAVDASRSSEYVQISLMIVLAHFTFIISDYISQHLSIFGHHLHVSAIISTAIASMVMGNVGRSKIMPHAREFVEKFWTESALLANSLVFLLIGLIFTSLSVPLKALALPILVAVLVVASARALSIYPVVWALNRTTGEEHIPMSWQHLLAWGSLRGALAITMVLLIPEDLSVAGWSLAYTPREFILGLTIGCIFATLFIKATTIKALARKLHTSDLTDMERFQYGEATALVHTHALARLTKFRDKGYIDTETADLLTREHNHKLERALNECEAHLSAQGLEMGHRVLRLYALGIEKKRLAELYEYGEVYESVYRRVLTRLTLQYEQIERGILDPDLTTPVAPSLFERVHQKVGNGAVRRDTVIAEHYMYYRTLVILSRTVLKEVRHLNVEHSRRIFGEHALKQIIDLYELFASGARAKKVRLEQESPEVCNPVAERLARRSILEVEARSLDELYERDMLTPKVYLEIKSVLDRDANLLTEKSDTF